MLTAITIWILHSESGDEVPEGFAAVVTVGIVLLALTQDICLIRWLLK